MGCGASSPADPLDGGKAPLAVRGKSSSVAPLAAAASSTEEDNPFLDPAPGIDEHKKKPPPPAATAPAPAPIPASSVADAAPRTSEVTSIAQPLTARSQVSRAAEDDDGSGDDDTDAPRPLKPRTPHSGTRKPFRKDSEEPRPSVDDVDDAPDAPTSPHEPSTPAASRGHPPLTRATSFSELVSTSPPSMNLADPSRLTTQLPATFLHYARKLYEPSASAAAATDDDEERLDRKAVAQLAYDCVLSFIVALKKDMVKVKEAGRKKEEEYQRRKLLPGETVEECIDTAVAYLKAELIYKEGRVTKTCFFFHFPRAYRAMFTYEKVTLERENAVTKWNKVCRENALKAEKEREKEKERLDKSAQPQGEGTDGAAKADSGAEKKAKKDKKAAKTSRKKKDRKTAPSGDLFANMAGHGSKLLQAEKKIKSAAMAGSSRNLLKDTPKDDEE